MSPVGTIRVPVSRRVCTEGRKMPPNDLVMVAPSLSTDSSAERTEGVGLSFADRTDSGVIHADIVKKLTQIRVSK